MDPQNEGREGDKQPSEELADWLKEVGRRRRGPAAQESAAELIAHLERLSETRIRTREDVEALVGRLGQPKGEARRGTRLKNLMLGVLLLIAILQYYFIEVQLQILRQPSLTVFVPAKAVASAKPERT